MFLGKSFSHSYRDKIGHSDIRYDIREFGKKFETFVNAFVSYDMSLALRYGTGRISELYRLSLGHVSHLKPILLSSNLKSIGCYII